MVLKIGASAPAIEHNLYLHHCPVFPKHCETRHIKAYDWSNYVLHQSDWMHVLKKRSIEIRVALNGDKLSGNMI
jgi:hypothetical protein